MRFHIPGLPGQPVTKANSTCAFTQKNRRFATMMTARGHEAILYGHPEHDPDLGAEYVVCYPDEPPPPFKPEAWREHNLRAAAEIVKRQQPGDFLFLMGGLCQQSLTEALPEMTAVEGGIGYAGSFADYRVFESAAWMHQTYGQQRGTDTADGSFYHAVIPASFDLEDFTFKAEKDDYLLYLGRITERKGVQIATGVARALDMRLILAGEGDIEPDYGEHIGKVGPKKRAELLASAKALIAPTIYIEPFGCVAVEAMLSGTPAITTDWGAFAETNIHGVTGYRCRTHGEFCWAVENAGKLNPDAMREYAVQNFSVEAVAPQYEAYFEQLQGLTGEGWEGDWEGISKVNRYGLIQPGCKGAKLRVSKKKMKKLTPASK